MNTDSENKKILSALKNAVAEALEKKRRLGQYAVIWRDGHPVFIQNNDEKCVRELSASYKTEK